MTEEINKFKKECIKIKEKINNHNSISRSVDGLIKKAELTGSLLENESHDLIKLKEKILTEYKGDKSDLRSELNTLFDKHLSEVVSILTKIN